MVNAGVIRLKEKPLPAVIRIVGDRALLAPAIPHCGLPFTESAKCQRDRRLDPDRDHPETTYNLTVSEACGDSVPQQIRDVEEFLDSNGRLIADLMRAVDGCTCVIDFSWDFPRDAAGQYNRFSIELLAKLAELKMDLEISVYGIAGRTEPQNGG